MSKKLPDLKPCPFCGGRPRKSVMTSFCGSIYIATVKCEKCGIEKKLAYSPGTVNKPKNAEATALRLAGKEWNRRAGENHKRGVQE